MERRIGVVEPLPLTIVRAGDEPVRQGEPCAGPWLVESGLFRVHVVDADGASLLLDLAGPGDVLGGPPGSISPVTARAVGPGRLRAVGHAPPSARLPQLALDLAWRSVPDRLERRLADLAARFGRPAPGGVAIAVRLSQDDLAAMVGASREATNRALRALERQDRLRRPARGRYVVRSSAASVAPPSWSIVRAHDRQ